MTFVRQPGFFTLAFSKPSVAVARLCRLQSALSLGFEPTNLAAAQETMMKKFRLDPRFARPLTIFAPAAGGIASIVAAAAVFFIGGPPASFVKPMAFILTTAVLCIIYNVFLQRSLIQAKGTAAEVASSYTSLVAAHSQAVSENQQIIESLTREYTEKCNRDAQRFLQVQKELNEILKFDFTYCISLRNAEKHFNLQEVVHRQEIYVDEFINHTARLFSEYTGQKCAACIKALSRSTTRKNPPNFDYRSGQKVKSVWTLVRDQGSRQARDQFDRSGQPLELYEYKDNTVFFEIMHNPARRGYYVQDNLDQLSSDLYRNANRRWREFYNNVAACALKNPEKPDNVEEVIGFLCVDSLDGRFGDGLCKEILACLSNIAYYSIRMTYALIESKNARMT